MDTTMARSPRWLTVGLIAAALATAGVLPRCVGSDPDAATPPTRSFDSFPDYQLGLVHAAKQRSEAACMAVAGHPEFLNINTTLPTPNGNHLRVSAASFGPPDEDQANRLGFGFDKPAEPPFVISSDPGFDKALKRCAEHAWDGLGRTAKQTYTEYVTLGETMNRDYVRQMRTELPTTVQERFLDCLAGAGFRVTDRSAFIRDQNPRLFGIQFGTFESTEATWRPRREPGTVEVSSAHTAQTVPSDTGRNSTGGWIRAMQPQHRPN